MKKNYVIIFLYAVLCVFILWIGITSSIRRYKCGGNDYELFINIPKSIKLEFCN